MKRYKLLKSSVTPFGTVTAGTEGVLEGDVYRFGDGVDCFRLSEEAMKDYPDWFEELDEDTLLGLEAKKREEECKPCAFCHLPVTENEEALTAERDAHVLCPDKPKEGYKPPLVCYSCKAQWNEDFKCDGERWFCGPCLAYGNEECKHENFYSYCEDCGADVPPEPQPKELKATKITPADVCMPCVMNDGLCSKHTQKPSDLIYEGARKRAEDAGVRVGEDIPESCFRWEILDFLDQHFKY